MMFHLFRYYVLALSTIPTPTLTAQPRGQKIDRRFYSRKRGRMPRCSSPSDKNSPHTPEDQALGVPKNKPGRRPAAVPGATSRGWSTPKGEATDFCSNRTLSKTTRG